MAQVVQIVRAGSAPIKRVTIDSVPLEWPGGGNVSKPKLLPKGEHVLGWYIKGNEGDGFSFLFQKPALQVCVTGVACAPTGTLTGSYLAGRCAFELE